MPAQKVTVPALYIAGDRDLVHQISAAWTGGIADLAQFVPQLRRNDHFAGLRPYTQQERPAEVNAAMIDFLRSL